MFRVKCGRAMTQTAGHLLFRKVLPECNGPVGGNCCAFSDASGAFFPSPFVREGGVRSFHHETDVKSAEPDRRWDQAASLDNFLSLCSRDVIRRTSPRISERHSDELSPKHYRLANVSPAIRVIAVLEFLVNRPFDHTTAGRNAQLQMPFVVRQH